MLPSSSPLSTGARLCSLDKIISAWRPPFPTPELPKKFPTRGLLKKARDVGVRAFGLDAAGTANDARSGLLDLDVPGYTGFQVPPSTLVAARSRMGTMCSCVGG